MRELIWLLKYERKTYAARPLAHLMLRHLAALRPDMQGMIIVPVPLHRSRERERGFNQATLIGARLADALSVPCMPKALARVKHTPPQAETKSREERRANIMGCFSGNAALVRGASILLVDDVFTSGETVREAVRALKAAGAKTVVALVAALA